VGTRKARHGLYLPYYREAKELFSKLPEVRLKWISRGLNVEADELAARALKKKSWLTVETNAGKKLEWPPWRSWLNIRRTLKECCRL
jgi:hypothetical protein